jgi:hypothetical protein
MRSLKSLALPLAALFVFTALVKADQPVPHQFGAHLVPTQEVPALSSPASGDISIWIDDKSDTVFYELAYDGIGTAVLAAHIHLGQFSVNGGVMAFLCGGGGAPACAAAPGGVVTGEITAARIIGPAGQGVAAGEFVEFVAAIRNGVAYANVHSTQFPGGEVRGQLQPGR